MKVPRAVLVLLAITLQLGVISSVGATASEGAPLPVSRETACGPKQLRAGGELKASFSLSVHRVACRRGGRLARRYMLSKTLLPGWHARYANYGQELFLCPTRQKFRCTHGRHVHMVFPDGQ